jgi:hypothetical protein
VLASELTDNLINKDDSINLSPKNWAILTFSALKKAIWDLSVVIENLCPTIKMEQLPKHGLYVRHRRLFESPYNCDISASIGTAHL